MSLSISPCAWLDAAQPRHHVPREDADLNHSVWHEYGQQYFMNLSLNTDNFAGVFLQNS